MRRMLSVCTGIFFVFSLFFTSAALAEGGHHWGYKGELSPENWYKADPAFNMCKEGKNQTPIDIKPQYDADLPDLKINYALKGDSIVNNGHTVQVSYPAGNTLTMGGVKFNLVQCHFHSPSENTMEGKSYPLEAHFVHQDAKGNLLVLAVFFAEGQENPAIASLWKAAPKKVGKSEKLAQPFDPLSILPESKDYVYFNGSLTTPPCSEGVRWCVLKSPLSISKAQAETLMNMMHGPNNRPLQPVNARPVLE
jgi:carbonic anhydrase